MNRFDSWFVGALINQLILLKRRYVCWKESAEPLEMFKACR